MEALFLVFCKIKCRTMLLLLCTCSFRLKMINEFISRPDLSIFVSQGPPESSKAFCLPWVCQQARVCQPNTVGSPWAKPSANGGLTNLYLGALLWVPNHESDLQSQATRISICSSEWATEIPKLIPEPWEHGLFHPAVNASNTKIPRHWLQKVLEFRSQKTSWPPH